MLRPLPRWVRWTAPSLLVLLLGLVALLPQGENPGAGRHEFDPATGSWEFTHEFHPAAGVAIAAGFLSLLLLLAGPLLAFPRLAPFLRARLRVRLHRGLGVAALLLAAGHAAALPLVGLRRGWLSGLLATLLLALHGLSGAWRGRLVAAWGTDRWRYLHLASAWAGLGYSLFHAWVPGWIAHAQR